MINACSDNGIEAKSAILSSSVSPEFLAWVARNITIWRIASAARTELFLNAFLTELPFLILFSNGRTAIGGKRFFLGREKPIHFSTQRNGNWTVVDALQRSFKNFTGLMDWTTNGADKAED